MQAGRLRRAAIVAAGAFDGDEADDAEDEDYDSDYDSECHYIHFFVINQPLNIFFFL